MPGYRAIDGCHMELHLRIQPVALLLVGQSFDSELDHPVMIDRHVCLVGAALGNGCKPIQ